MRKIASFLIAASLAALVSCQREAAPSAAENAAPAVLHATFESPGLRFQQKHLLLDLCSAAQCHRVWFLEERL